MSIHLSPSCETLVLEEMRRRAPVPGSRKRLAHRLGIHQSSISDYFSGQRSVPEVVAWRLIHHLRQEELDLADKIEAELLAGSPWKDER